MLNQSFHRLENPVQLDAGLHTKTLTTDMIAIPDFISGAMEHWGLITYRETNLLYDDLESSSYNKQRVAAVVSHELAHMWFGNLGEKC